MADQLTGKRRQILEVIEASLRDRGYPPSVREIGEAVGLTSTSTVHAHLATLQRLGYLRIPPGSELRRQAAARGLTLAAAAAIFLAAALVLDDGYRSEEVSGFGAGVAGCGELVLVLGAVWPGRRAAA